MDSSERVHSEIARLTAAEMFTEEEIGTTCCFATQDKVWVTAPDHEKWEIYAVLADSETFGDTPRLTDKNPGGSTAPSCCATS